MKLTKILKEYILQEVGNSRKGYPLSDRIAAVGIDSSESPLSEDGDIAEYEFSDDDGNEYRISIKMERDGYVDVSFQEKDSMFYDTTNRGKQFKIMATVVDAVEREIELESVWGEIKGIRYMPTSKDSEIDKRLKTGDNAGDNDPLNARDRLYRAFIKDRMPDATIVSSRFGGVQVTLNKNAEELNEVGDSVKGYNWRLDDEDEDIYEPGGFRGYSFSLGDKEDTVISVYLFNTSGFLSTEFQIASDFGSSYRVLNKGVQFKIMGTIVNIIKYIIHQDWDNSIKGIRYSPVFRNDEKNRSDDDSEINSPDSINKRDNLYRAYIKKAFPNKELKFTRIANYIKVEFPKQEEEELNEVGDSREPYEYSQVKRNVMPKVDDPIYGHKDDYPDIYDNREDNPKALVTPGSKAAYTFKNRNGKKYYVDLNNQDGYLEVDFHTDQMYAPTGDLDQFKIMATISSIIADELNLDTNAKIKGVHYYPTLSGKEASYKDRSGESTADNPNKRDRLYRAFITSIAPGTKFRSEEGNIIADIPQKRPVLTKPKREINEVGESTEGYPFTLDYEDGDIYKPYSYREYGFRDKDDDDYGVEISNRKGYLHVDFGNYSTINSYGETNKREQFKIMGTVVAILKSILKGDTRNQIKGLEYVPVPKFSKQDLEFPISKNAKDATNQRDLLYRAYIKKAFPGKNLKFVRDSNVIRATFPKS